MLERRDISEPMHVRTCPADRRVLIRFVAAATIRERRLFRSALAQVRLLFESGVYSRGASIRSYTVIINTMHAEEAGTPITCRKTHKDADA